MDSNVKKGQLGTREAMRSSSTVDVDITNKLEPADSFYICSILFFFIGFMVVMPMSFLGSAANYWFFKFRNTTLENYSAKDRTELQTLYQSCSVVAQNLPSVIFTSIMSLYGHKLHPKSLTVATLVCLITVFTTFAIFTQIDTDSWQTGFFITSMLLLVVNSAAVTTFQITAIVIVAKFPNSYMEPFLLGRCGIIISDILQIISISITDYHPTAAVIYFTAGLLLIVTTLVLLLVAKFTEPYKVYVLDTEKTGETGNQKLTWSESKEVIRMIWPSLVLLMLLILTISCVHPAVDSLVASEFDGDGTLWTEKYFVPVITFLLADASGLAGRICSLSFRITKFNQNFYVGGGIVRCFVCVVFVMFCNAQPRSLPVIFNRDWQYIIFVTVLSSSNGFLFNIAFMSLNGLSANKSEISLKLCTIVLAVSSSAFSGVGILMVKLL